MNTERDTRNGGAVGGHREKVAVCKPRREASEGIKLGCTLTLDLHPPEM